MSSGKTVLSEEVVERSTARLTGTIVDLDGDGFKPETLTLLLYDLDSGQVINSRNRQSILDANGGTVSAAGALVLELTPDDNTVISRPHREKHIALLEWTWDSAAKQGRHEVHFYVTQIKKVS